MQVDADTPEEKLELQIAALTFNRLAFGSSLSVCVTLLVLAIISDNSATWHHWIWAGAALTLAAIRFALLWNLHNDIGRGGLDVRSGYHITQFSFFSAIIDGLICLSGAWLVLNALPDHAIQVVFASCFILTSYAFVYMFQRAGVAVAIGSGVASIILAGSMQLETLSALDLNIYAFSYGFLLFPVWHLRKVIRDSIQTSVRHEAIAEQEKQSNYIFNQQWTNTPLAGIKWDRSYRICSWNPSSERVFGFSAEEALGNGLELIFQDIDIEAVKKRWRGLWKGYSYNDSVFKCKTKDGRGVDCQWHDSPITRDGKAAGMTSFVEDITSQLEARIKISEQANFDSLTGLPNRRQMVDKIEVAINLAKQSREFCALIFLDLDHFKDINDTEGHEVGDLVLREFSKRLKHAAGKGASVARFGGDEFVILLENLGRSKRAAHSNAERLLSDFLNAGKNLLELGGQRYDLDLSAGVALTNGVNATPSDLLKNADLAMYQVKESGRNGVCFYDESMTLGAAYRVEVLRGIKAAMDAGELELYCQPIQSMSGGGEYFENLLRWRKPDGRVLAAGDFIDIISDAPFMAELGYWVIDQACLNINDLRKQGLWSDESCFFINVSARQLAVEDFSERLAEILASRNIEPRWITLEITEQSVVRDYEQALGQLKRITALGVRVAIDDFGTGYSSLAFLKNLPVHFLKLDREFIASICKGDNDVVIVEAIIKLCSALSINVVAEGVETQAQYDALVSLGCDYVQGYFLCRPMPLNELSEKIVSENEVQGNNVIPIKQAN